MRNYCFLILCLLSFGFLSAQEELSKEEKERRERNIQAGNPFAKFGYKAKVATLSKGKYLEVHDLDSIVTIGTTRWHVDKNKIVGDIVIDSLNPDARPIGDVAGRWISPDPLSEEFPSWSPYNFVYNNPLSYVDPDGRSGEPVIDKKNKTITVHSNMIFYGGSANSNIATSTARDIQDKWNNANGKVSIDGAEYSVRFSITGTYNKDLTKKDVESNTDIKNNFIRVEETVDGNISFVDGAGSNTGYFLLKNIQADGSTTEGHEYGHGLGLEHPANTDIRGFGPPGIMFPRGTIVDPEYQYNKNAKAGEYGGTVNPEKRSVTQDDINNLGLDKLKYDSNGKSQLGKITKIYHEKTQ